MASLVTLLGFILGIAQLVHAAKAVEQAASVTVAAGEAARAAEAVMKAQFRRYLLMQLSEKERGVSLHPWRSAFELLASSYEEAKRVVNGGWDKALLCELYQMLPSDQPIGEN